MKDELARMSNNIDSLHHFGTAPYRSWRMNLNKEFENVEKLPFSCEYMYIEKILVDMILAL